ncbi:transferrin receptor protein 2 [Phaenicophaeus curvirostris]|uniref:transferrin receptor protein 2 n=1 Tax=Phaenicophaeus curvirostris TaxID=33595 RepID=UPI0037F09787
MAEAPPPGPRLQELLQRHLREQRLEGWVRELGPPFAPPGWGSPPQGLRSRGLLRLRLSSGTRPARLQSIFGALEGRLEPEVLVLVGARRDAVGPGAAAAGVGTALLLELARLFAAMGRDGFQLRRTLLFVSWDGGEFGHLGATEWLEAFPNLLPTKVAAYLSLDQAVLGDDRFVAKTSPVLAHLLEGALAQVESPNEGGKNLLEVVTGGGRGWESVARPLPPDSAAFAFTAAAGVPAIEIGFDERGSWWHWALGTREDSLGRLQGRLGGRLPAVAGAVAAVAAHLLLPLAHDARLPLDPRALGDALLRRLAPLQRAPCPQGLRCLASARGDVVLAAERLRRELAGSDARDERLNRGLNARVMAAEASLLSPFVSPLVSPLRHVLLGRGGHTLGSLLGTRGQGDEDTRLRLELLARTLRGAAGALGGGWERGGGCGDSGDSGDTWGEGDNGDNWGNWDNGDNGDNWDGGGIWKRTTMGTMGLRVALGTLGTTGTSGALGDDEDNRDDGDKRDNWDDGDNWDNGDNWDGGGIWEEEDDGDNGVEGGPGDTGDVRGLGGQRGQ